MGCEARERPSAADGTLIMTRFVFQLVSEMASLGILRQWMEVRKGEDNREE